MNELNIRVIEIGVSKWRKWMEKKSTLVWFKSKEYPKYEKWHYGGSGRDLLLRTRAKRMELEERTYIYIDGRNCQPRRVGYVTGWWAGWWMLSCWSLGMDEWTTEERMITLLSFGNRVSDAIVRFVNEFLDRNLGGPGVTWTTDSSFLHCGWSGEDGSGAVTCKNATVDDWRDSANHPALCYLVPSFLDCIS